MHHQIRFVEGHTHDVVVVLTGTMTVQGNRAWPAGLVRHPRWRPGARVLVDCTKLALGPGVTGEDVRALAHTAADDEAGPGAGFRAMVVDSPVIHGLLRMWQASGGGKDWQTEVFYSRADAIAWLTGAHQAAERAPTAPLEDRVRVR